MSKEDYHKSALKTSWNDDFEGGVLAGPMIYQKTL